MFSACDPKYLPEEKKMPINMTVKEWEAVPDWARCSPSISELPQRLNWVNVFIADGNQETPHSSVHVNYVNQSKPVQEIAIAVWADGEVRPISVAPETHIAEAHANGLVCPTRYEVWDNTESIYRHLTTRRVEMRPVVMP
jgi:glycerophosphoryl diester phosphodiesterase